MNNKEMILSITDKDKSTRIDKILSLIHRNYELHVAQPNNEFPTSREIINIVIPSKTQKNKIVLFAHHDVYPGSLGYNDNSSGVVILLKLQDHLPENVEIVFTDFEEVGGQGCGYYLESCLKRSGLNFEAVNLDVCGLGDKIFYEEYGRVTAFPIPKHLTLFPNIPFSDSRVMEAYKIPNIIISTGSSKDSMLREISESMHCRVNDDRIDLINEDTMNMVFDTIKTMITK